MNFAAHVYAQIKIIRLQAGKLPLQTLNALPGFVAGPNDQQRAKERRQHESDQSQLGQGSPDGGTGRSRCGMNYFIHVFDVSSIGFKTPRFSQNISLLLLARQPLSDFRQLFAPMRAWT
jgi:hypothetical protein